ncbi:hypothetical protein PAECIP111893_01319 [Paenibacillus plantiphilus]|uniref:Tail specific protease domain-containing protein n=1 Tax=Paenibacillus plantiphilus TaxID=2905650 RepID=A0ABM9BZ98_9BACL|nr:hypothetical protein [Paenibacillus plantiphilus]CAH1199335.1 hypothetical protein PAECIP111893_01319 [Paenibacillus plantiphilus]
MEMLGWRDGLEGRWREWKQLEDALGRTLAGRTVLRVAGKRPPRGMTTGAGAHSMRLSEGQEAAGAYNAGLACFCLGELDTEGRAAFLENWHKRLQSGATAIVADRRGKGCETAFELHELFAAGGTGIDVQVGRTYWWVRYEVR